MLTLYRVKTRYDLSVVKIKADRANEKSVWIDGRRSSRFSDYYRYFDSFQEAKDWLIDRTTSRLERYEEKLEEEAQNLKEFEALKESDVQLTTDRY